MARCELREHRASGDVNVFFKSMTLWAAIASCSIGLVGHICNIQYTNMLYHYTFVYVFVFVPKTWVFHGIQVHTPGAAHGTSWKNRCAAMAEPILG